MLHTFKKAWELIKSFQKNVAGYEAGRFFENHLRAFKKKNVTIFSETFFCGKKTKFKNCVEKIFLYFFFCQLIIKPIKDSKLLLTLF